MCDVVVSDFTLTAHIQSQTTTAKPDEARLVVGALIFVPVTFAGNIVYKLQAAR